MNKFWVFTVMLVFSLQGFATEQIPEILIYEGLRSDLLATPLDSFLEDEAHLNQFREIIGDNVLVCSADWDGYQGTWEIVDEKLYLVKLHAGACDDIPREISLKVLFGQDGKIFSDWFTGKFVSPASELRTGEYVGFTPIYEKYLIFEVDAGNVTTVKESNVSPYENP